MPELVVITMPEDEARALGPLLGQLARLRRGAGRTSVALADIIPRPIRAEIISVDDNYLFCRPMSLEDRNDASLDFPVAKYWLLRRTSYDGKTRPDKDGALYSYAWTNAQERVATKVSDSTTETQVVVPQYRFRQTIEATVYPGDEIECEMRLGGTGVTRDVAGVEEAVVYVEANQPRAWAKKSG